MSHFLSPPRHDIPAGLVSLSDYAQHAKSHIRPDIFEYIVGGGADEWTLARNRQAFDRWMIVPNVLADVTEGGTHTTILGDTLRHPVMLAPVAFHQLVHPEGEWASAEACSVLETGMVVSTLASQSLESISDRLTTPKWFQLYFQESKEFTLNLVRRAEAAGFTQIMITVDASLHGIRNRAQRAGFELPEGVMAVNLVDRPPLPRKVLTPDQSIVFQGMMTEAPTWKYIEWLLQHTRLPVTLKGILSPADALKAKELGVAGVVVSNHGGRALDGVPSALEMLPEIRSVVGEDYPLILDGGVERGTDVFKAIALGADVVMIGRPQLYALSVAGALGVAHMLRVLREEFEVTMAMAGTASIHDIKQVKLRPSL